jgi:chemotaxis protein MotB
MSKIEKVVLGGLVSLVSFGGFTGCVSMGKYRRLENDNKATQLKYSEAQQQIAALEQKRSELEKATQELADQKKALEAGQQESTKAYENLVGDLKQELSDGMVKITQYKNKLSVDVAEKIFFNSGKAAIKESGREVLRRVGNALKGIKDKQIRVEGHTDNVPVAKNYQQIFPTNWELSVIRATNVVRFLQDEVGIAPELLMAVGHGEYQPIAPNDTADGRKKNRRIEILLQDKEAAVPTMETAPASPTPPATAPVPSTPGTPPAAQPR